VNVVRAEQPLRVCIYGDNRGSNRVHRAILKQARVVEPRLFLIVGDVLKFDYGYRGTPEAVLNDYRAVFATPENSLEWWPAAPGPAVFVVPGGHDEQFFLDPKLAAVADTSRGKRYAYEGTNELGVRLYEAFDLEEMHVRVQPFVDFDQPLPMSPYGDYLLMVGSGARHDLALLLLYRTDRWCFRADQIDWVDSTLAALRAEWPHLPLIAAAHDWTWYLPDTLDDGHLDGANNSVRDGSAKFDALQKQRLRRILLRNRADLAVAADLHAYWADADSPLLRLNCGAAICTDAQGARVAFDNLWLEYVQTPESLKVIAHPIEPPIGCGLRSEAAAYGIAFVKSRAAGSVWRRTNP
jgi:hypothetical protein